LLAGLFFEMQRTNNTYVMLIKEKRNRGVEQWLACLGLLWVYVPIPSSLTGLPLFPWVRNFTCIAQYWLVQGTGLSVIYKIDIACFTIKLK